MNLILITESDVICEGELQLSGRRRDHIIDILGSRMGDVVRVGRLNGPIGSGTVIRRDDRTVTLQVCFGDTPPRPRVTVILAMVRPQIMKRTLQHLAMLGVRRIVLVGARRVEPAYFGQRLFDGDGYIEHLMLGLEQAVDTWLPEVTIERRFKPFVEDVLPGLITEVPRTSRYVAHPAAERLAQPHQATGQVALAIGPEGGWSDYEIERLVEIGFEPLTLGPRTLRVETAVPYLFGALGL